MGGEPHRASTTGRRPLRNRTPRLALLLVCALVAVLLRPAPADPARLLPVPPDADALLLQPRTGLDAPALVAGLARLGLAGAAAPGLDAVRLDVPPGADAAALAARLGGSGLVRSVEPDGRVVAAREDGEAEGAAAAPTRLPNDPLLHYQLPYLEAIRAPEAWARQTGSGGVVIAIIDSGLDLTHPDMQGRIFINEADVFLDGRDNDGSGCVDDTFGCSFVSLQTADPSCGYRREPPHRVVTDDEGHGTFVAGIAAAAGNNALGMTGLAWDVRILPVKVLDCTATGGIADAAAGIRYAARQGAHVINVSFGSRRDSIVLREAVEFAQSQGALVVASAGNDARLGATFPAAYPGVLSVAASGARTNGRVDFHMVADFTSIGPGVELLAPGRDLLSTIPRERCGRRGWVCLEEGPYAVSSGSSFASPLVAGAAALLIAEHPGRSTSLVRGSLLMTLQPAVDGTGAPAVGLLDLAAALERELFGLGVPGTSRADDGPPPASSALPAGAPAARVAAQASARTM